MKTKLVVAVVALLQATAGCSKDAVVAPERQQALEQAPRPASERAQELRRRAQFVGAEHTRAMQDIRTASAKLRAQNNMNQVTAVNELQDLCLERAAELDYHRKWCDKLQVLRRPGASVADYQREVFDEVPSIARERLYLHVERRIGSSQNPAGEVAFGQVVPSPEWDCNAVVAEDCELKSEDDLLPLTYSLLADVQAAATAMTPTQYSTFLQGVEATAVQYLGDRAEDLDVIFSVTSLAGATMADWTSCDTVCLQGLYGASLVVSGTSLDTVIGRVDAVAHAVDWDAVQADLGDIIIADISIGIVTAATGGIWNRWGARVLTTAARVSIPHATLGAAIVTSAAALIESILSNTY